MNEDMTVPCGDGLINVRVGAIIIKNGRLLMVENERADYCYSVGGRIKFGETAEEAIVREVYEETGIKLGIDSLGFIHENYFYGDSPTNLGKMIYELSFFFYMKTPDDFEPVSSDFADDGTPEHLVWVSPDTEKTIYPTFFKTEKLSPDAGLRHLITDERNKKAVRRI